MSSILYCCNSCGHLPDFGEDRSYFMTSCGHVLCKTCSQMGGSTCLTCQMNCRYVEITNPAELKPEIKVYFSDPLDVLREAVARVVKLSKFQNTQAKRYKNQMNNIIGQCKSLQGQLDSLVSEDAALKTKLDSVQRENAALKQKLDLFEQRDQTWIGNGVLSGSSQGTITSGGFFSDAPLVEPVVFVPPQPRQPEPQPLPSPFFGPSASTSRAMAQPSQSSAFGSLVSSSSRRASQLAAKPYGPPPRLTRQHTPTLTDMQNSHRRQLPANNGLPFNLTNRVFQRSSVGSCSSGAGSRASDISTPGSSASHFGPISARGSTASSNTTPNTSSVLAQLRRLNCQNNAFKSNC